MKKLKPERRVYIILECEDCGSRNIYEADLFRKAHLREYTKKGYVMQCCGCIGRSASANTPHRIAGLHTESVSRVGQERSIVKDLTAKRWG